MILATGSDIFALPFNIGTSDFFQIWERSGRSEVLRAPLCQEGLVIVMFMILEICGGGHRIQS